MLTLVQLLHACGVELNLDSYKVHLAYTPSSTRALDDYLAGSFKEYQEHQTRRNFECQHVIGLVGIQRHRWVFAGAWKVLGGYEVGPRHYHYDTELLPGQGDLLGRVIVHHQRAGRQPYLRGTITGVGFDVASILDEPLSLGDFPGFRRVSLSFAQLRTIVKQSIDAWRTPLASVNGIYVIANEENGAIYVGSATGQGGLWQRWSGYVATGHGGNVELRQLLDGLGIAHADRFRFSILEVADLYATEAEILERGSYWKIALGSRVAGYNSN